jgi:two-component system sensor histidine kinase/response regulator
MKKILVIEDELMLLDTLKILLEAAGFEVILVSNGTDSLALLKESEIKIDIIICDINLPDIDGYDILKSVRNDAHLYRIPFIFLTAFADEKDIRSGMNLGADDYLTKPFTRKDLLETIDSRLKISRDIYIKTEEASNLKWLSIINTSFRQEFYIPINNIRNLTAIINTNHFEDTHTEISELMTGIRDSSYRMYRNSRNLITFALTLTDHNLKSNLHISSVNLYLTLKLVLNYYLTESIQDRSANKNTSDQLITLKTDKYYINDIFTELIDNAIKFNVGDEKPVVMLRTSERGFTFLVLNNVSTKNEFKLDEIAPFKKFHTDTAYTGLGIGLYLCTRLCSALGYKLKIKHRNNQVVIIISGSGTQ